jgi:asparagine synthase (glutamine-hydrolysing)
MCGIAGIVSLKNSSIKDLQKKLEVFNHVQKHRGPDEQNIWMNSGQSVGFAHQRLSIIDLNTGSQPMHAHGLSICYNGEIYNFKELKKQLSGYDFKTTSDTEVILAAYQKWGTDCVNHFDGMFSFALWDANKQTLFIARDRFGIKPLYYYIDKNEIYFASEIKTLLPVIEKVKINYNALKDYLYFQMYLGTETLVQNIFELKPAHTLIVQNGTHTNHKYWEVFYNLDWEHDEKYFTDKIKELVSNSVKAHTVSDVPIGAYVSGGIDSGIVASLANDRSGNFIGFTGKFEYGDLYDESYYAKCLAKHGNFDLHEVSITAQDFINDIEKVIYHLDQPVAGPGSFAQFQVSRLAAKHRKVVLGGQGGDEIFGGYTRYLIAYFEQCIKGAIDGTLHNGNFVVTYESIIPNLESLQNYKPMLKQFFSEGMFDPIDKRYFKLVNRANDLKNEINWNVLGTYQPFESFSSVFNSNNVGKESYFDKMTHFDFKTLLPALLQVEDRMSMAFGLESRVPFLDHHLIEFAATIPADKKFKNGTLKMALTNALGYTLPDEIKNRKNKMGFPVPLNMWLKNDLKDFVNDIFNEGRSRNREFLNYDAIMVALGNESEFGRKIWGLLSLELWMRQFVDKTYNYESIHEQLNIKQNI